MKSHSSVKFRESLAGLLEPVREQTHRVYRQSKQDRSYYLFWGLKLEI